MPNTLHLKGKTETVPDYQVVIDYRTETTNGTNAPEFHIDRRLQEFGSKMSDLRSEFDKNPFETFESPVTA